MVSTPLPKGTAQEIIPTWVYKAHRTKHKTHITIVLYIITCSYSCTLFSCTLCSTYLSILFYLPQYFISFHNYLSILLYIVLYCLCCIFYIVLYCFLLLLYLPLYLDCMCTECTCCYDDLIWFSGTNKVVKLSEYCDSESEFEDGLHSEYAPQGSPQAATGAAQEPATTKKIITLPHC